MNQLTVGDYLDRILSALQPLNPRKFPIREAFGAVLAEPVHARFDLPPFASSAMDGFAVRAADLVSASPESPARLRLVAQAEMGRPPPAVVGPGEAILIPTGGMVPPGADSIVPAELASRHGDEVLVRTSLDPGRHVRPAGEDLRAGEVAIDAGCQLSAADLGVLAACGAAEVKVVPPVRVGIVSTGDELVRPPRALAAGQIYDSNAPMLSGQVREAGAEPVDLGRVADDPSGLLSVLDAATGVDLFVCSGGVSAGPNDPVRRAFGSGGDVCCVNVEMKPGRPQAFGFHAGKPFFGLPGNPLAAFVSFEVFVRPALRRMMALPEARPPVQVALDGFTAPADSGVRFLLARLARNEGNLVATPHRSRQSNLLVALSQADALVELPGGVAAVAGTLCLARPIRHPSENELFTGA